ncbi:MAG: hypothetical protein SCARUB_03165, partial [Candidatus Scalindua rubra]
MKNKCLIFLAIFTLVIIQNCTTTEKIATEKQEAKTALADEDLYNEVQVLKAMLGYKPKDTITLDTKKIEQPVELGMNLKQVQERFPAPDKFEYDPMTNKKVTMLARDAAGGRFTFFFYEDKLYKIVTMKNWKDFTIQYAEDNINSFTKVFLENHGEPDAVEEDEMHKKMTWLKEDLEITLEEFSLMTHQGMNRVLSLVYADRNISPLARSDEPSNYNKQKEEQK